jgi:hypothetical protein
MLWVIHADRMIDARDSLRQERLASGLENQTSLPTHVRSGVRGYELAAIALERGDAAAEAAGAARYLRLLRGARTNARLIERPKAAAAASEPETIAQRAGTGPVGAENAIHRLLSGL